MIHLRGSTFKSCKLLETTLYFLGIKFFAMASPPRPPSKRQKREQYLVASKTDGSHKLPKKKFYRQRAHANPFSDHQLT